jgi:hypothetical protein
MNWTKNGRTHAVVIFTYDFRHVERMKKSKFLDPKKVALSGFCFFLKILLGVITLVLIDLQR